MPGILSGWYKLTMNITTKDKMDNKEIKELNNAISEMFGKLFPENITFTSGEFVEDPDVFVEFKNNKWTFIAPLPGVKSSEIKVSFKNNVMTITSQETRFCEGLDYSFKFDYNVEVNMVKVYLESGVLNVIVDKPMSKEFNIDIE
jgi:HSP20 family molecular chaperone IbpA